MALKKAKARKTPKPRAARNGHDDIRLWLRLLYCSSHIESIVQSRIMGEFGISLARFDLMSQLERVGGGLTMSEVSRRMMVSNGATTSLVDKLVEDGLVQREAHPEDRRTTLLHLTSQGRERFLGGTGTIAGALSVNTGGTVAPGTSVGKLTVNNQTTFGPGGTYAF